MIRRLFGFKVSNLVRIFNLQFDLPVIRWQPIPLLIVGLVNIAVWFLMVIMREDIVELSYFSQGRFRSHTRVLLLFDFDCCYIKTDIHIGVGVAWLLNFIALELALLIFKNDEHHANDITSLGWFDFVNDQWCLSYGQITRELLLRRLSSQPILRSTPTYTSPLLLATVVLRFDSTLPSLREKQRG